MPTLNNKLFTNYYKNFNQWVEKRPHRERVYLLLFGLLSIYLFWYTCIEKDILQKRSSVVQQISVQKKQLSVFQREINRLSTEGVKAAAHQKLMADQLKNNPLPVIEYATPHDSDQIIKAILLPQDNVNFVSLKTTPVAGGKPTDSKNNFELTFNSNYFATMTYLTELEKLPWCLSWDNLTYKVGNYPNATVVINVHIVNN